jgi:hypothetical protein
MNLNLSSDVIATIQREARKLQISAEERATQIVKSYHQGFERFPDGVLRDGRQKLIEQLSAIPCLSNFESSGIDFRFWWVSFELDVSSPIAWVVVRFLGVYLNTLSGEMQLPTSFKPIPDEWPDGPFRWQIESTAPLLDPRDVVHWLADKLPRPLSDIDAWNNHSA